MLWFNPEEYDKIIIVFSNREDRPGFGENRLKAIAEHPLKPLCWNLTESNFWRDETKYIEHQKNYTEIVKKLQELNLTENDSITTHNSNGEYGHADHILLHNAIMDTVNCKVNGKNPISYREIKNIYEKYNVWSWH